MKLWVAFMLGCFVVSVFTLAMKNKIRQRILVGMVIAVMIGYYFFHQI